MNPELEKVLLKVQKPGRYAGGESNRVVKDQEQVDVRQGEDGHPVRLRLSGSVRGGDVPSGNENIIRPVQ